MKKRTLGEVIKERREAMGLTQRELAAKLAVKASHVAYLENGRRRPSLSLLGRLADVLGLEKEPLFLLAHPEARALLGFREPVPAVQADNAWRKFLGDHALLARHRVTPRELRVLKQVNLLGRVSSPRQFLFILNSIRQAIDDETF